MNDITQSMREANTTLAESYEDEAAARLQTEWRFEPSPELLRTSLESCGLAADDTATVLSRLAAGQSLKELSRQISSGQILSKRTAHGRRHFLTAIKRRYIEAPHPLPHIPELAAILPLLSSQMARSQILLPYLNYLARAREAHADLHGRQLPGAAKLKTLVDILDTATEPDLPVGRLKQLLAKAREYGPADETLVTTLKPLAELLRAVERLRTQDKLDALASVRMRVTTLYPLRKTSGDGNGMVAEFQELQLQVGNEKLVMEADRAIQRDSRCFASYAADYRAQHTARHQRAEAALAELEAHKGWEKVSEAVQTQLRNPIVALDCEGQAELALPAAVCRDCGKTFKDLHTDIELIEYRAQQALRALDEALAPPLQPKKPAQTITMDLRSPADLPRLYERIAEVAKEALSVPRRVRVIFEDVHEN
jgi:hypothetical protein